jgi:membrane fusion protein, multidrug efflux system
MLRKILLVAVLPATVLVGALLFSRFSTEAVAESPARGAARAVPVAVSAALRGELPISLSGLGTAVPFQSVTVRSRVPGQLVQVAFREGELVAHGQLLAEVDPRVFRARLMQAEGQLAKDQAILANAERDLERAQALAKDKLISEQEVSSQASLVNQYRALQRISQGVHDAAALELSHTKITAPIRGRIGFRQLDVGNNVDTTGTIAVIHGTQPIYVVFTLPEDVISAVARAFGDARRNRRELPVEAWDKGSRTLLSRGRLTTFDNQIDAATGTVKLKAEFDNQDGALFPNQFVNVRFVIEVLRDAVTVPAAAVQRGREGPFAYVVSPDQHVASVRELDLGPTEAGRTVVRAGLEPGELVVLQGVDQVREGAHVAPSRSDQPRSEKQPGAGSVTRPGALKP